MKDFTLRKGEGAREPWRWGGRITELVILVILAKLDNLAILANLTKLVNITNL